MNKSEFLVSVKSGEVHTLIVADHEEPINEVRSPWFA